MSEQEVKDFLSKINRNRVLNALIMIIPSFICSFIMIAAGNYLMIALSLDNLPEWQRIPATFPYIFVVFLFVSSSLFLSLRVVRSIFDKWLSRVNSQKAHVAGLHISVDAQMEEITFQVWPPQDHAIIHTLFAFPLLIGDRVRVGDFTNSNLLSGVQKETLERITTLINKSFPSFIKIIAFTFLYGVVLSIGLMVIYLPSPFGAFIFLHRHAYAKCIT
eukprot:TRINITY_DN1596_c0_g1_i1.p1 TRINITY_DN1596_c0_g1~~TRINITY_DN1596_c0_g1_i1.p1  ORF type:complete len:218 (+),score=38.88 TRINITY_DN1596_c0_g1_i1:370-1023(+)